MCPSCFIIPENWDRDYYDYQFGVKINGVEYHEVFRKEGIGFFRGVKDGVCFIFWDGWAWSFGDRPGHGRSESKFGFKFTFATDSSNFSPSNKYLLTNALSSFDEYYENPDAYSDKLPVVSALFNFGKRGAPVDRFRLINGFIVFGAFDDRGYNSDTVTFEFEIVNAKGDTLRLTDGYVKKYYLY